MKDRRSRRVILGMCAFGVGMLVFGQLYVTCSGHSIWRMIAVFAIGLLMMGITGREPAIRDERKEAYNQAIADAVGKSQKEKEEDEEYRQATQHYSILAVLIFAACIAFLIYDMVK